MPILLGDVGGTNARLALARDGAVQTGSLSRFRGDDFACFDDVLRHYLQQQGSPVIDAVCVAVAGPVGDGRARLTNRDWQFDQTRLADLTGAGRVRLINDLTALGHSLASLQGDGLALLRPAPDTRPRNGQSLVVGLGTGFNVCVVHRSASGRVTALEAEEGHAALPLSLYRRLEGAVGRDAAAEIGFVENLLSGRGLSRLHQLLGGPAGMSGKDIGASADAGDALAGASYDLFAELTGMICRELAMHFMPREGLFLAGGVGRSIARRMACFERGFLAQPHMRRIVETTPVMLITDDMAALQGCLAALS